MLDELLVRLSVAQHGLTVLFALSVYVVATYALKQRRRPSAAIAWVISLALLPYVALPLYLMFGSRKIANRPLGGDTRTPVAASTDERDTPDAHLRKLAAAMGLRPPSSYHALNVHQNGAEALETLRSVIEQASNTLELCTFLFGKDDLGKEILHRLECRARDGVRVRLMVDGVGVYLSRFPDLRRLSAAGVETVLFVPPLRSSLKGRTNLRNHRKLVIADCDRLWCGGRNLTREYFADGSDAEHSPRSLVDLTFDLRGTLAHQASQQFDLDWAFATRARRPAPAPEFQGQAPMGQIIASGPDQSDDTVHTFLVSAFFAARRRILAVTPYFVPDATLLMSLCLAARRGAAVDLVIPKRSNHRLADIARNRALRDLASAGGRVWLVPHMIHAKAVVVDDHLALVGSANLDERSLFLNYELMVAFYEGADVARFATWIEDQRDTAGAYTADSPGLLRDMAEGLLLWLGFQL